MRPSQDCGGIPKGALAVSGWTPFTMVIGGSSVAPTKGTVTLDKAAWRRNGTNMEIVYSYAQSAAGSGGTGTYLFPIPNGNKVDMNILPAIVTGYEAICGYAAAYQATGVVSVYNASNLQILISANATASGAIGSSLGTLANATESYSFYATVPIAGWNI